MNAEKQMLYNLYWEQSMTLQEIADQLDWSWSKVYYRFRDKHNIPTHKTLWEALDFSDQELREKLNTKYSSMKRRVNGLTEEQRYKNLSLLSEPEFIDLCNEKKDRIIKIWNQYKDSDHNRKYSLSVDRIDNSLGYTKENIQFVPHGFNSWKNDINPIRVKKDGQTYYFSSAAEAGRAFDCRADDIGEVIRNSKYNRLNIQVEDISLKELLKQYDCSLYEYYLNHLI